MRMKTGKKKAAQKNPIKGAAKFSRVTHKAMPKKAIPPAMPQMGATE